MRGATLSLIRWAGGKARQLDDLLPFIPDGKVYVEPFGGGASVLLNRPRSEVEVYNDLDSSLVNLFSVMRDDRLFDEFAARLGWTPYSREVFTDSLGFAEETDAVLAAVKFYTILNQSISGKRLSIASDWARAKSDNLAERWVVRQQKLGSIHNRLRLVQIECRDALDILSEWDSGDTVFYCDPPYVLDTRNKRKYYAVEPGDEYHKELVKALQAVKGSVVLSGYVHPIYDQLADAGWVRDSYKQYALMTVHEKDAERDVRKEVVWRNPRAASVGVKVPLPFDSTLELNHTPSKPLYEVRPREPDKPRLNSDKPKLLDLFCGAGGCTKGYQDAGFYVVGVDNRPQPHYVGDEFFMADAVEWLADHSKLEGFDAIHASPPCQAYSRMRHLPWLKHKEYPMLIEPVRELLQVWGGLYVIENVHDAPLDPAFMLCGVTFGLRMYRHRYFESNVLVLVPPHQKHQVVISEGPLLNNRYSAGGGTVTGMLPDPTGHTRGTGTKEAGAAMGVPWMNRDEMTQAIPPRYTQFIGEELLRALIHRN